MQEQAYRVGAAWSVSGLRLIDGKYPLAVERYVLRQVARLVPGVTTVTPHARYYALHALVATEAEERALGNTETQELLRRCEVVLAAASHLHGEDHGLYGLPQAHGEGRLRGLFTASAVEFAAAVRPAEGGYTRSKWGFLPPYQTSERELGILTAVRGSAGRPAPGPRLDRSPVREGLEPVLDLARGEELRMADVEPYVEQLCVCRGGAQPDGRWLAELLCRAPEDGSDEVASRRRETVRLLTRVLDGHPSARPVEEAVGEFLALDPRMSEGGELAGYVCAADWRGLALRNYSVTAWRRLWSWLVGQAAEGVHQAEWADRFARAMPPGTVGEFWDALPTPGIGATPNSGTARFGSTGSEIRPEEEFAVLAQGARWAEELTGDTARAYNGPPNEHGQELHPRWFAAYLTDRRSLPLAECARELAVILLRRSARVALAKSRPAPDGRLRLPTKLQQRDSFLFTRGPEGTSRVILRLNRLAYVLAGCGVLTVDAKSWRVTELGRELCA
ncbi:hypothetical protein [Kitasatospora sp. NPDC006786]|uniref:hypothetical protein n=1 Tax=unclassified Kitasatospora TaxID=2633591 RepID=UPI0034095F48